MQLQGRAFQEHLCGCTNFKRYSGTLSHPTENTRLLPSSEINWSVFQVQVFSQDACCPLFFIGVLPSHHTCICTCSDTPSGSIAAAYSSISADGAGESLAGGLFAGDVVATEREQRRLKSWRRKVVKLHREFSRTRQPAPTCPADHHVFDTCVCVFTFTFFNVVGCGRSDKWCTLPPPPPPPPAPSAPPLHFFL